MSKHQAVARFFLMGIALAISSCDKTDIPTKQPDVVVRLCKHIVQDRHKMIVDTNSVEIVWSDGAILEIGTTFPPALQEIISRPTHYHDIRSFLNTLNAGSATEWRDASVLRSPRGDGYSIVRSVDGKISATVDSIYVEYLRGRYPTSSFRIKAEFEPIICVVGGEIRSSIMPVKF